MGQSSWRMILITLPHFFCIPHTSSFPSPIDTRSRVGGEHNFQAQFELELSLIQSQVSQGCDCRVNWVKSTWNIYHFAMEGWMIKENACFKEVQNTILSYLRLVGQGNGIEKTNVQKVDPTKKWFLCDLEKKETLLPHSLGVSVYKSIITNSIGMEENRQTDRVKIVNKINNEMTRKKKTEKL